MGSNSNGYYKKWSNGLIEQWGNTNRTTSGYDMIYFPYSYTSSDSYSSYCTKTPPKDRASLAIDSKTESYIKVDASVGENSKSNFSWYVIGY